MNGKTKQWGSDSTGAAWPPVCLYFIGFLKSFRLCLYCSKSCLFCNSSNSNVSQYKSVRYDIHIADRYRMAPSLSVFYLLSQAFLTFWATPVILASSWQQWQLQTQTLPTLSSCNSSKFISIDLKFPPKNCSYENHISRKSGKTTFVCNLAFSALSRICSLLSFTAWVHKRVWSASDRYFVAVVRI